jgi:hypothetical protein
MRKVFTMDEVLHLPLEPMCVDDTVGPLLQNAAQVTNRLIGDRFPRTEPNDPYRPHPRRGRALRRRSQNGPGAGLVCVGAIWGNVAVAASYVRLRADHIRFASAVLFCTHSRNEPVALIERDADPLFLPPDDVAEPFELIAGDEKREAVGDEQRGDNFERRTCFGQITNGAINSAAAELNRSGFQHAVAQRNSVFVQGDLNVSPMRYGRTRCSGTL